MSPAGCGSWGGWPRVPEQRPRPPWPRWTHLTFPRCTTRAEGGFHEKPSSRAEANPPGGQLAAQAREEALLILGAGELSDAAGGEALKGMRSRRRPSKRRRTSRPTSRPGLGLSSASPCWWTVRLSFPFLGPRGRGNSPSRSVLRRGPSRNPAAKAAKTVGRGLRAFPRGPPGFRRLKVGSLPRCPHLPSL